MEVRVLVKLARENVFVVEVRDILYGLLICGGVVSHPMRVSGDILVEDLWR